MNNYRPSQYNIVTSSEDGGLLITNNLYNVHLKIGCDDVEKAASILKNPLNKISSEETTELIDVFIKKRILIPDDMREKELVDYYCNDMIFSDDILHLSLIPTEACNFRCKYCYQSGIKHTMSDEIVKSIKKYLEKAARKYKGMFISWYGGEPTLAKEQILEIMGYAKTICRANGIPLYGQMTTNGYALSKDYFEELLNNHVLSYMITIDGLKDTHNIQRPHFSDPDSYSMIMNNLRTIRDNVKKNNFRIGIRINISPAIVPYLKEYVDTIGNEFGNDKRFGIIWEWVKDWGGEQICNNFELIMDSYDSTEYKKYLDYITEKGLQIDQGQAMSRLGSEMCIASRKNGFVINFDGKIYKCAMGLYDSTLEEVNCIGELRENGNLFLDEYKNSLWVGQSKIPDECGGCLHYPECMGLLCPLAAKIRDVFICPHTLDKDQAFIARNLEKIGRFEKIGNLAKSKHNLDRK